MLLLEQGANVDETNVHRATPLHKAAYYGFTECCQLLLSMGANVHAQDVLNATALHKSAFNGFVKGFLQIFQLNDLARHTRCCELLIQHGALMDCKDKNGATPLHMATYNSHAETSEFFLKKMKEMLMNSSDASDG